MCVSVCEGYAVCARRPDPKLDSSISTTFYEYIDKVSCGVCVTVCIKLLYCMFAFAHVR